MAFRRFNIVGHRGSGENGEQAVGCGYAAPASRTP